MLGISPMGIHNCFVCSHGEIDIFSSAIILKYMAKKISKKSSSSQNEIIRHFDIVAEDIKSEIQTVAEQVGANTEKLEEHDAKFDSIQFTLDTIQVDIEFIKHELKQKVNRDEFAVLERRLSILETKFNRAS